jgi:hypothetical protein
VRRVLRALTVHPLPGSAPELQGLAEFGGEPLPVLNLARLVNAAAGANPAYPVTIVVWAGPPESREMMGLAADAALEVADVPPGSVVVGDGGFLLGEAPRRFWPGGCEGMAGLAVHGEQPLVVVDPQRPPELLWLEDEGEEEHVERE